MNKKNDTALLVVDVQRGLFNRPAPLYKAEQLVENVQHLVQSFKAHSLPVVYIQHENKKFLQKDSENWQLHPELRPGADDLRISKSHGNAFKNTALQSELEKIGAQSLVVCGLTTHGCVNATCLGALALGYRVILAADTHSSYHKSAAQLIEDWNRKLHASGAELAAAGEISKILS